MLRALGVVLELGLTEAGWSERAELGCEGFAFAFAFAF